MKVLFTITLLLFSNVFMTMAWYGHLRFMHRPLWIAVLASWSATFFEYCFQVPANRLGHETLSSYQLKTLQEIMTLSVFIVFAQGYLGEGLRPKHMAGFLLLALAALTVFQDRYALEW